tara:strand:- start:27980 stop:28780 length:801 start_codon:yes stop_codon:yes gene_type:complete
MPEHTIKDWGPIEQEAVLIIKTELSEFLVKFKSNELSFPGLRVAAPTTIDFQDIYFDTPTQQLGNSKAALRLREQPDMLALGLKGHDSWTNSGVSRIEIEEPWSANGLASILHYLSFMGIDLKHPGVPIGSAKPLQIMKLIGLRPIQSRSLKRKLWPISDKEDRKVCFLALDIVTLNISSNQIKFGELEIELTDGSISVIRGIVDTLIYNYPELLKSWRYSKLQTGGAIESLFKSANIKLVNDNGELTAAGISHAEQLLRKAESVN